MYRLLVLLTLATTAMVAATPAGALCIGCGCERAYDACLHNEYPPDDSSLQGRCHNDEDCCKKNRRSCHGTGIHIQLFAISPSELEHFSGALNEFDSPVTKELGRSAGLILEGLDSDNYEQRLLFSTQANAITPMLSSEEGQHIERAIMDFEVPFTQWLDRDNPSGVGDFETLAEFVAASQVCPFPVEIECRTLAGVNWTQTGEVLTCSDSIGLICINSEQPAGTVCSDYEVRFRCPFAMP